MRLLAKAKGKARVSLPGSHHLVREKDKVVPKERTPKVRGRTDQNPGGKAMLLARGRVREKEVAARLAVVLVVTSTTVG